MKRYIIYATIIGAAFAAATRVDGHTLEKATPRPEQRAVPRGRNGRSAVVGIPRRLTGTRVVGALSGLTAQGGSPVRPIGPIGAKTHDSLRAIGWVRALSDGRVLVNDRLSRRVLLYDSSLTHAVIVVDTAGTTARAYGNGAVSPGMLIPYLGDSTLFLDEKAQSLLVIDPDGRINRAIAIPIPGVSSELWANGPPGTDHQGRIVLRLNGARTRANFGPVAADTAPIVRVGLNTHRVDTVGFVRTHTSISVATGASEPGAALSRSLGVPFSVDDDWALLSDGSVAIVRGHDVHVDFVDDQGVFVSTPKLPNEWQRLSDTDKVELVDSMRRVDSVVRSTYTPTQRAMYTTPQPLIAPEDIPDYRPAFLPTTTRGDAEGNVWVKLASTVAQQGGPIYMIVDRRGTIVDRVQLPGGCTLVGFGPGVAYLASREGSMLALARARIR